MTLLDISRTTRSYLEGSTFSSGHGFRMNRDSGPDRLTLLPQMVRGRRVLHVGFGDHLELLDEKRSSGTWLHDLLCDAAAECVGVDVDAQIVAAARERGVSDVYVLDVTEPAPDQPVMGRDFDVILFGEVLEHIPDPVNFLSSTRRALGSPGMEFIVTVPNAWAFDTLRNVGRNVEMINTDHRFWFTPYTLAKVMTDAGLEVTDITTCESVPVSNHWKDKVQRRVTDRWGLLRASVVGRARIPS